jgi:hypothetical protein
MRYACSNESLTVHLLFGQIGLVSDHHLLFGQIGLIENISHFHQYHSKRCTIGLLQAKIQAIIIRSESFSIMKDKKVIPTLLCLFNP